MRHRIKEKTVRNHPALIQALTGLPAKVFWQLLQDLERQLPAYERPRHPRPHRQRGGGGGRPYAQTLGVRVMVILSYLRLHIAQAAVAVLCGVTQVAVSRELRRV